MAKVGTAELDFIAKTAQFQQELQRVRADVSKISKDLDSFGALATKTGKLLQGAFVGFGGALVLRELAQLTSALTQYAEEIQLSADRTGIAVEQIQRLQFLAEQSDTSFDALSTAINRMQRTLVGAEDGSDKAQAAIARIGLSVGELMRLKPDEQFQAIAVGLSGIVNPAERAAAEQEIFGKGAAEIAPLLRKSAEELNALSVGFDQIGGALSGDTIEKLDSIDDGFARLATSAKNLGAELLALGADPITVALDAVAKFFAGLRIVAGGGGDELVNLDNQIRAAKERVEELSEARFVRGPFLDDLIRAQAELDLLILKQQTMLGLAGNLEPKFQQFGADLGGIGTSNVRPIFDPTAPRDPTAADRRASAAEADPLETQIQANVELEQINQEHLNTLLLQQQEFIASRLQIESEGLTLLANLHQTLGLEEIAFEETKAGLISDISVNLVDTLGIIAGRNAKVQKSLALFTAATSTAAAITNALRDVPFPKNLVAATLVAAKGYAQIRAIKATNYSPGGSVSLGGYSAGSAAETQPRLPETPEAVTQQGRVFQVIFQGPVAGEQAFLDIIRKEINDRDSIVISSSSRQAAEIRGG